MNGLTKPILREIELAAITGRPIAPELIQQMAEALMCAFDAADEASEDPDDIDDLAGIITRLETLRAEAVQSEAEKEAEHEDAIEELKKEHAKAIDELKHEVDRLKATEVPPPPEPELPQGFFLPVQPAPSSMPELVAENIRLKDQAERALAWWVGKAREEVAADLATEIEAREEAETKLDRAQHRIRELEATVKRVDPAGENKVTIHRKTIPTRRKKATNGGR